MSAETPIAPQVAEETPASATLAFSENTPGQNASPLVRLDAESPLAALRVQLDVRVPVPNFRVQDLLSLEKGRVLETRWSHGEDLPIWCGGVQLVWTEFEVVDQKLAARVTRLA
jgi:flagellar motor switch protein FliN/FliY